MKIVRCRVTRKPLQIGILYIPKKASGIFPSGDRPVRIAALMDGEEVELNYNPRYRRVHGLTGFYRRNDVRVGDQVEIEILEPFKRYRFKIVGRATVEEAKSKAKRVEAPLVGSPINFRGLVYAPVNENGVIFLFGKVAEDLGIVIEGIQAKFPDAFGKRYEAGRGYPVTIEFEYKSSDYKRHRHPLEGCDLIVCWEHDWKECPIQVVELKSLVERLR